MRRYLKGILIGALILGLVCNISFSAYAAYEDYFHYGFNSYYMYGVKTGQSLLDFKNSILQQPEVTSVSLYDENLSTIIVDDENIVYTGMHAYINKKLVKVIVYGDVSGDGVVSVSDKIALRNYVVSGLSTSSPYFKAGDMDFSNTLSSSDVNDLTDYIVSGLGTIYGFSSSGAQFPSSINQFQTFAENLNYSNFIHSTDSNKATVLAALQNSTIFVTRTHGNQYNVFLTNSNSGPTLDCYDIDNLANNALSKNRLAYFGGCSNGAGGENASNLVNSTYNKGAKAVIGFGEAVFHDPTNVWSEQFFKSISNGVSINQAMAEADYAAELLWSSSADPNKNRLTRGDLTQILAHPNGATFAQLGYSSDITTMSVNHEILASDIIASVPNENDSLNNDVTGYFRYTTESQQLSPDAECDQQMLQNIAHTALNQYIPIDSYSFDASIYCNDTGLYTIRYIKQIQNRNSSDTAFVMLKPTGEIVGIGIPRPGIFDNISVPAVEDSSVQNYVNTIIRSENSSVISCTIKNTSYVLSNGQPQLEICIAIQTAEDSYIDMLRMSL